MLPSEQNKYSAAIHILRNLVNKLDKVVPYLQDQAVFLHIHGQPYTGPTYEKELHAARVFLSRPENTIIPEGYKD